MGIFDVFDFETLFDILLLLDDSVKHRLNLKFYHQACEIVEKHSTWVMFFVMRRLLLI